LGTKPHLLVLNKKDLCDLSLQAKLLERLRQDHGISEVIFTNCKDDRDKNVASIIPRSLEIIRRSPRYNREGSMEINLMIIGVPNVGKSSLINRIRNKDMKRST